MKTISAKSKVNIEFSITLNLTVDEASALDAIVGYGVDEFLKTFYQHVGKAYLEPYESSMKDLFKKVKEELPFEIAKIKTAQEGIQKVLSKIK
jgi:hypothetical protein